MLSNSQLLIVKMVVFIIDNKLFSDGPSDKHICIRLVSVLVVISFTYVSYI